MFSTCSPWSFRTVDGMPNPLSWYVTDIFLRSESYDAEIHHFICTSCGNLTAIQFRYVERKVQY